MRFGASIVLLFVWAGLDLAVSRLPGRQLMLRLVSWAAVLAVLALLVFGAVGWLGPLPQAQGPGSIQCCLVPSE